MPYRLVSTLDVAELDPTDNLLETLLESSTEFGLIGEDLEGKTRVWNAGARLLFGMTAEMVLGTPTGPILHGSEVGAAERHLRIRESALAEGRWDGFIHEAGTDEGGRRLRVMVMPWQSTTKTPQGWLILITRAGPESFGQRLLNLRRLEQASVAYHHPRRLATASLEHLEGLIPCSGMVVWIFDFASRTTEVVATWGERETQRPTGTVVPLDLFGLSDIAELYAERDVNVRDIQDATHVAPVISELIVMGLRAVVRIPLLADARLIGALEIQFDEAKSLDPEQLAIVHEVAQHLAVSIRHAILFQEVRSSRERLRMLSRQLLKTQEEERRHLARELHDEIGQSLTAVRINLQQAIRCDELRPEATLLKECDALVHHVLQQVRDLSLDLRPAVLDDLGLVASIRWYVDRMARRAGLKGHFSADPPEIRAVADIETTCFRVVQEAVTNIARHAKAREVAIELNRIGGRLELTIRDDGIGFDVASARKRALKGESLGIIGMQERVELVGGRISMESAAGRGTEIRARIPLELLTRASDPGHGSEV